MIFKVNALPQRRSCRGLGSPRDVVSWMMILAVIVWGGYCYNDSLEVATSGVYGGPAQPPAPVVGINSVGRARLSAGGREGFGGTCFLLKDGSGTLLLGAYHVLGSADNVTLVSKIPKLAVAASALPSGHKLVWLESYRGLCPRRPGGISRQRV